VQNHILLLTRRHLAISTIIFIWYVIFISVTCVFIDHQADSPRWIATKVWKGWPRRCLHIIVSRSRRTASCWCHHSWWGTYHVIAILILEEAADILVWWIVGEFTFIVILILAWRRHSLAAWACCLDSWVILNNRLLITSWGRISSTHGLLKSVSVRIGLSEVL